MWNASAIVRGMSSASCTRKLCLVIGSVMPRDVRFLERVRADRGPRHLPGDRDDRHRVHVGVGDRGDQVGGARTRGRHADPDLAGRLRVSLGGVAGALLVADQDVPDLVESNSGSYAGRIAPPGMPKTTSAPTSSSERTSACAPVISALLLIRHRCGLLRGSDGWVRPTKNPSCRGRSRGGASTGSGRRARKVRGQGRCSRLRTVGGAAGRVKLRHPTSDEIAVPLPGGLPSIRGPSALVARAGRGTRRAAAGRRAAGGAAVGRNPVRDGRAAAGRTAGRVRGRLAGGAVRGRAARPASTGSGSGSPRRAASRPAGVGLQFA